MQQQVLNAMTSDETVTYAACIEYQGAGKFPVNSWANQSTRAFT